MNLRPLTLLIGFIVAVLSSSGCQSTSMFGNIDEGGLASVESARIFVNGRDRGTTPQTLRIYRGRHELSVELRQGRKTVRTFTLEETYSPNAAEIDFSFLGRAENGTLRLTVEELPTRDDVNFIIPFYENTLTIEDNQYGLTLLVAD